MATRKWSTVWKGTYDNSTAYVIGDFVLYSGATYTCIADSTGNLPTNTSFWVKVADKGDTGSTGSAGSDGSDGAAATIAVGTTTTGAAGTDASVTNSGTSSAAIFDFTIPQGKAGSDGTNGTDGADGKTVLNGSGAPSSATGVDGDFYIDTTNNEIYGPKTSGAWGSGTSLVGPQGPAGADGTGSGDMMASTYDPNNVAADAFDMDNMVQGITNKFVTAAELTVLGNTSGTNTGDQTSVTGNAGTATKLATGRTIRTNLASTSTATFDGSANVTPGVTGTLPVGNGGTGATSLTGILKGNGTTAVTAVTAPTGTIVGTSDSQTITNKRNEPRTSSSTSTATLTPDLSSANVYYLTAQAADLTIAAPTGTPIIGEVLAIYITDDGTSRGLTFNAIFDAYGAALPDATTAGKTLQIIAQYDGTNWSTQTAVQQ